MRLDGKTTTRMLAVLVLAAATASAGAGTEATTTDSTSVMPVDLTGVWNLDAMASDDLAAELEVLQEVLVARLDRSRPGGGSGGEEGVVTGPGRSGARGRGDAGSPIDAADTSAPRELVRSMEQLLITVDGDAIEIMDGSDRTRIWTPGARPVQRPGPGGEVIEQAWWDGDVLVLSTTGGPLIATRRLHLEDDGKTLVADVTVKISGSAERVDARVVYTAY